METNADLAAWQISEHDFPAAGNAAQKLAFGVNYAVLAPSAHNTQPWCFHLQDDQLRLYADRTRALAVVDHADRELTISCGAALFALRLSLRHFGYEAHVDALPEPNHPDLLARVTLGKRALASDMEHKMFAAILERRTTRVAFEDRRVPDALLSALANAAEAEGAWLWVVKETDQRSALAELVARADREQWADPRVRRELAAWVHANRAASRDGMPGYAMGMGDLMSVAGPIVMRTFDLGRGMAAKDRDIALGSPALVVLGTKGDNPKDWLMTGQALMHVLLRALVEGVTGSYLNQAVQITHLRDELRQMLANAFYPQLCLRLGYGPSVRATPRRRAAEVMF